MNSDYTFTFKIGEKYFECFERRRTEEGYHVIAMKKYIFNSKNGEITNNINRILLSFDESEINPICKEDIINSSLEKNMSHYVQLEVDHNAMALPEEDHCITTYFTFISLSKEEYISPSSGWNIKPAKRK